MNRFKASLFAATFVLLAAVVSTVTSRSARAGIPVTATPVRDVESGVRDRYQDNNATLLLASQAQGDFQFAGVPAGKRLVIEFVSSHAKLPPNQRPLVTITVSQGGVPMTHHIPLPQANLVDQVEMFGSQPLTLYADPGTTPFATFQRVGSTSGQAQCSVTISGHYVTL